MHVARVGIEYHRFTNSRYEDGFTDDLDILYLHARIYELS